MRPVRRADNLTTFKRRLSRNLGASTSWNPVGLSRPVMGLLYFTRNIFIFLILTLMPTERPSPSPYYSTQNACGSADRGRISPYKVKLQTNI
jgi:hypothetical protein